MVLILLHRPRLVIGVYCCEIILYEDGGGDGNIIIRFRNKIMIDVRLRWRGNNNNLTVIGLLHAVFECPAECSPRIYTDQSCSCIVMRVRIQLKLKSRVFHAYFFL